MLLEINNLKTQFDTPGGEVVRAVDGVSLDLDAGRTLALVGESGCGKSLTALSVIRLLPPRGRIAAGGIRFDGLDMLNLPEERMRGLRGNRIAMIFQEPMTSLNPLMTVGEQIEEALRLHRGVTSGAARRRTIELLREVGLPAPEQRLRDHPHQMSGGMRQRVMIAMALACAPDLLIADEPTTALDVTVQAQILDLLCELQRQNGMALLFITHDLGVVSRIADDICVMYSGRIVERGPAAEVLADPRHPYTRGLLRSTPRSDPGEGAADGERPRLPVIPGEVPTPLQRPAGCAFHPRCELGRADPECQSATPALRAVADKRVCACWRVAARVVG